MKKCGLYVRVSTERQAMIRDGSLDTQESRLRAYVSCRSTAQESWEIADVYREEGASGKDTNRPQIQRLLADVEAGRISVILCTKIDRVTRSLLDFFSMFSLFQRKGVEFISIDESFDTSTATGRAMLKIILVFAELERERTSERTREKMAWRAEEGLWNGGQVLGYDIDPENKGVLIPSALESQIVRFLFETYLETGSVREAARRANARGWRTKSFKSRRGRSHVGEPFTKSSVVQSLRNPVYIGKVQHKGRQFQARHQAIVEMDLWNKVQSKLGRSLKMQRRYGRGPSHVFRLKSLVRCGQCGSYMTPYFGKCGDRVHHYYKCTRMGDGSDRCTMRLVRADALEDVVLERLKRISGSPELAAQIVSNSNGVAQREADRLRQERDRLLREKSNLDDRSRHILDVVSSGHRTESLLKELEQLDKRQAELKAALQDIDAALASFDERLLDPTVLTDGLRRFNGLWSEATEEEQRELMQLQIRWVVFRPDRLEMAIYESMSASGVGSRQEAAEVGKLIVLTGRAFIQRNGLTGSPIATLRAFLSSCAPRGTRAASRSKTPTTCSGRSTGST